MGDRPCPHFAKGRCAFGTACRLVHDPAALGARRVAPAVPPPASRGAGGGAAQEVCRFFQRGNCSFGDKCRNAHPVDNPQEPSSGSGSYVCVAIPPPWNGADSAWAQEEPRTSDEDGECGICFENIKEKGERFGLLQGCDHAFCLSCIRSWRQQQEQDRKNKRLCPVCRNESGFVIPSDSLIMGREEKNRVTEEYQAECSRIPCKKFDYGRGKCPFGTSCHYAHLNEDGTRHVPAPLRWMAGADGSEVRNEVKMSDFFR